MTTIITGDGVSTGETDTDTISGEVAGKQQITNLLADGLRVDGSGNVHVDTEYGDVENRNPAYGNVGREYSTQHDIEIHVGDGYKYEKLQNAFNNIPHHINHEVRIFVHGRTNDNRTTHIHNVQMSNEVDFIVDGSDGGVIANGGVNVHIAGKLDHIQFEHLTFEDISQCIDARFEKCTFRGNGRSAFSGKQGGKMLIDCEIGDGSDKYAVESIGSETIELRDCTLNAQQAAVRESGASLHTFTGNNTINAPEKVSGADDPVHIGGAEMAQYDNLGRGLAINPTYELQPESNPNSGVPLVEIKSADGAVRLGVDHDGETYTENKVLEVGDVPNDGQSRLILGDGSAQLSHEGGGIVARDDGSNSTRVI